MKKYFKWFLISSILFIVLFNIICFILPNSYIIPKEVDYLIFAKTGYFLGLSGTYYKYGGSFWVGYISIMFSLIGNILITYYVFNKSKTKNDMFYGLSTLRNNFICLGICFIVSIIVMFVPNVSIWVGTIVSISVLAYCILSTVISLGATNYYSDQDNKLKESVSFIENLKAKSQTLYENCESKEKKEICKKVYEMIKYSDPISNENLNNINEKISQKYSDFENSINSNKDYATLAKELTDLINERNNLCRTNK